MRASRCDQEPAESLYAKVTPGIKEMRAYLA